METKTKSLTDFVEESDNINMLKLILAFLCSSSLFAAAIIRDATSTDPVVTIVNTNTFSLTVDASTDGGLSEDFAHKVYVPLQTTTTANTNYYKSSTRSNLPRVTSATTGSGTFVFTFDIDLDSESSKKAHIAIKNSSDDSYSVIASSSTTITGNLDNLQMAFSLTDVCGSGQFECTTLVEDQNPSIKKNTFIYVFLDESANFPTSVDPTSNTSGIFYELKFSTKIYTNTVTLDSLEKGDSQLVANFQGFGLEDFEGAYTLLRTCTGSNTSGGTIGSFGVDISSAQLIENGTTSGQAKTKELTNDQCYKVNVFLTDKYGFASLLSNDLEETPESIQALLKKQACFFFSAGFGTNHFTLNTLRSFRDDFLMKTSFGKVITFLYYKFAPQYALDIYHSESLSKLFRAIGYTFHYLFQVLAFCLLSLLLLFGFRKMRTF